MKMIVGLLGLISLVFSQACFFNAANLSADENWKNFFVVQIGNDSATDHARYAKQMGYDSISIKSGYVPNYRNIPDLAGLKFFLIDPQYYRTPVLSGHERLIDTTQSYAQSDMDFYNQNMAWKSNEAFPDNLATGWWSSNGTVFRISWDFQQQAVIDSVVENIITLARDMEDPTASFTFGGWMLDVPRLLGDFNRWDAVQSENILTSLSYWTGADSGLVHDNITHEYATYSEARAAFYKQLNTRMRQEFPDAKWIFHPFQISNTAPNTDEWIQTIKNRVDKDELTPDMLFQEKSGTEFADDADIFNSGVNITRDRVGISQPNRLSGGGVDGSTEVNNRLYAAKAAINGSWYNYFKKYGGEPEVETIMDVYPRHKLIRLIPNWDNLNGIPVNATSRVWNNSATDPVYNSYDSNGYLQSHFDGDAMYSRQPKTGKLFAVFLTTNGVINLNIDETVVSMQRTDSYFVESGDASADFDITGNEIRLKSSISIDVDSSNGQVKGNGYIFTISSGGSPKVTTGSATNVTSNSAALNGTVNASGLSTTAWFEYDVTSGSYGSQSSTQSISGSSDTTVSFSISELSEVKTYYYRLVANNSAGTTYGSEMSFTTLDATAPNCSISINNDDSYTNSTAVTLTLSATDDVGVTGYYVSTSSTVPLATDTSWTTIASTTSYNANVSYTLSSGDGSKTVYVWYKDAAGNVSSSASDSITLDMTVPTITITIPTSSATYETTSSTINLGGSASDSKSGVKSVTWSNSRGGSGTASGDASWSISNITLSSGDNVITVTATDWTNNTSTDTITVTYTANDNLAPTGSISINNNDSYTNSTAVTLTLSATDDVGVTGYYVSNSSTVPLVTDTSWTAIASTTSYNANVSYTLSSGGGSKVVYVWYKDAAGNMSSSANDSITLDTTVPTITITIPTSSATNETTSSTINLGGSASDSISGVKSITWSNSRGGSGTAIGTTSWSISNISLHKGKSNVITVKVTDGVNKTSTDTITVVRR